MARQSAISAIFGRGLAAAAFWAATSTASLAANTYVVDRTVGPTGRITGTIVTNGTSGVLSAPDIIDWNLAIDADGDPTTVGQLLGPLSGANSTVMFLEGVALTATPTGLFFDFGSQAGFSILQIITFDQATVYQLLGDNMNMESVQETHQAQSFLPHPPEVLQFASGQGPSFLLGLSLNRVRVREETEDVLRLRANFTPDQCGDGIDPAAEPVSVVVSTPIGNVYPAAPNVFPIVPGEFELVEDPTGRRWQLTAAARERTGIERFDIDDRDGSIVFVDRLTSLPTQAYQHLIVELTIGNDTGRAESTLVEEPCGSGRWHVGR